MGTIKQISKVWKMILRCIHVSLFLDHNPETAIEDVLI